MSDMRLGDYIINSDHHPKMPLLKRPFDIILSASGMLIASGLSALIWIAIILEDGFPVFIRQERIGKNGRLFKSLKFRSMFKGTMHKEKIKIQAVENDPRITRVGRILRKCAFDEMPQLINIFLGQMSFVGPRALLPVEIEVNGHKPERICDVPGYEQRVKVLPGLTGLAQVYAARDLCRRNKFKYDLLYIRHPGFLRDLGLIATSFLITFHGTWEKRSAKMRFLERSRK